MENINIKNLNTENVKDIITDVDYIPLEEKLNIINDILLEKNIKVNNGVVEINRIVIKIVLLITQVKLYTNLQIDDYDFSSYDLIKFYELDNLIPEREKNEWDNLIETAIKNVYENNSVQDVIAKYLDLFVDDFSFAWKTIKNNIDVDSALKAISEITKKIKENNK